MKEPYVAFVGVKLGRLVQHAEQLRGWSQQPINESKTLQEKLAELRYSLAALQRFQQLPVVEAADRPQAVDAEKLQHLRTEATRLEAAIEACTEEYKRRHETFMIADHVAVTARNWLAKLPEGTPLNRAEPVKLENGGNHQKTLAVVRTELAEVQDRLRSIEAAPLAFDELDRRARQWIDAKGRQQNLFVHANPFELVWTKSRAHPVERGAPDPVSLLCKFMAEPMRAMIVESYGAWHGLDGALSDAEREVRIGDLSRRIADLEAMEEALIMALLDSGVGTVSRRRDASPAVLLGCTVGAAKAIAA